MFRLASFLLLLCFLQPIFSHICLMYPPQRGEFNVTDPADYSCYQPQAPCGTTKANPNNSFYLIGGSTFYVLLQQNLNHYNPGWPGFIEVAWSPNNNQTSDDDFTQLYYIPDYWSHFQAKQQNFSIPVVVPNLDCDPCTLQVRYNPNKPTEPIFHNCADISIRSTSTQKYSSTLVAIAKTGDMYSPTNQLSSFVKIDRQSGQVSPLYEDLQAGHVGQRSLETSHDDIVYNQPPYVVSNGLIAPNKNGLLFFGQESSDARKNLPLSTLYQIGMEMSDYSQQEIPFPSGVTQWAAILPTNIASTPFIALGQNQDKTNNIYTYSAFWMEETGDLTFIATTQTDSTFVNFLWAEYAPVGSNGQVWILGGDENSLTGLGTRLFTVDIASTTTSHVDIDYNEYTISSFHYAPQSGQMIALSPGLVEVDPAERVWSLISIDYTTGTILSAMPVSSPGEFTFYYGGAIYGEAVTSDNLLLHVFRRSIDLSYTLRGINIQTGNIMTSTGIDLGVNTATTLISITNIPQ